MTAEPNMNAELREAWLRAAITRVSGASAAEAGLDDDLADAVGLDSLGRLEVLAEVEDEFDFLFEDTELVNALTIGMILEAIELKLDATARVAE